MVGYIAESLKRVANLSFLDWRYLTIAVKELLIARIRYAARPIGEILRELQGEGLPPEGGSRSRASDVDATRLSWAIGAVAARVPWRSDCLLQVMAADRWLRRRQLRPDFFLGVSKNSAGTLKAHAWLSFGKGAMITCNSVAFTALLEPSVRRN
jgi:hypothetical protein